jgi:hypothetical protein
MAGHQAAAIDAPPLRLSIGLLGIAIGQPQTVDVIIDIRRCDCRFDVNGDAATAGGNT